MNLMRLHPGLRLSVFGGVIFIAGLLSLIVLPALLGVVVMIGGGMGVWSGFLWTLFSWYSGPPSAPEEGP